MNNIDQSRKKEDHSSFLKREFLDFSFEITIPSHYELLKPIDDALETHKNSNLSSFQPLLMEKIGELPLISSLKLYFPKTLLNDDQCTFLIKLLLKMSLLQKNSICLATGIEESHMTTWRNFYYGTFLKEILENKADLSFLTRFKEYEHSTTSLNCMNNCLNLVQKDFKNLKEFTFVNGNLEDQHQYPLHLRNVNNLLHNFSHSLEKISLFFRTFWLHPSDYLPIFSAFEDLSRNNKLKSLKIALLGAHEPVSNGVKNIIKQLYSIFDNEKFNSLKEFGIFLANSHMEFEVLRDCTVFLSTILHRLKSISFIIQTDFQIYSKEQIDEILKIFFQGKAKDMRNVTLGFCADKGKTNRPTNFGLNFFGSLIKENEWCLFEFNLYYEASDKVNKRDVANFLIALTKYQEFLLNAKIMIMQKGLELVNAFGFSKIFENYLKEKKNFVLRGKILKRLKKVYRIEILNEIMEKFI